ncbi:hypothetical protein [Ruegeria sp. EL01]|jgi:hypothetical protein|uniref:hypothetical protein n=1 Tax=Ruegeria sp. EL01 TaxID=2107578 RepID=UPI000EA7FBE7|nr:hypothetical protein [Ruegeria sp. EL01]
MLDVLINNAGSEYTTPISEPADHADEVSQKNGVSHPCCTGQQLYKRSQKQGIVIAAERVLFVVVSRV